MQGTRTEFAEDRVYPPDLSPRCDPRGRVTPGIHFLSEGGDPKNKSSLTWDIRGYSAALYPFNAQ